MSEEKDGEDNEDDEESEAKKFKNDGQSQIKVNLNPVGL